MQFPIGTSGWADWLRQQNAATACLYFDDGQAAYAVRDTVEFKEMLA